MAPFKKYIFLLILILGYKSARASQFDDYLEAAKAIWNGATGLYNIATYLWSGVKNSKILDRHSSSDGINSPISDLESNEKKQIRQHLKFLAAQGDSLLIDIHAVKDVIKDKLVQNVAGLHDLNQRISDVSTYLYKIDKTYDSFLEYVTADAGTYDLELLSKFATEVVQSGSCGIKADVVQINALLIGQHKGLHVGNLIDLLLKHFETFSQYTRVKQSQQQLFYSILTGVFWCEIKAFLVTHYAYYILNSYTGNSYKSHIDLYEKDFLQRNSNTLRAFKAVMQFASREYYKGDPHQHIEDVTYTQLKNLFQIIVLSAIDINRNDGCSSYCDNSVYKINDFSVSKCYDENEKLCGKQRPCTGDIVQCGYGFKNDMEICLPKNSTNTRRYEYVIDGNGQRSGPNKECDGEVIKASSKKYWDTTVWTRRCDYCTCVCAEKKNSDRYFSLHMSQSRYSENYVITGVRFIKRNNIVHIQAQEGQLLPGGTINSSTVVWIPLPKKVDKIFTIKWPNKNEIDLQDFTGSNSQALVGVQLFTEKPYRRLSLEVTSLPIDYLNGQVLWETESRNSFVFTNSMTRFPYTEFELPTRFIEKNTQKTKENVYGYFTLSGKSDVGQSVVPFIDIQDIVTDPPAPLAGLGVYIRYIKNSGGFLALKIFTYNYEWHLNPNL